MGRGASRTCVHRVDERGGRQLGVDELHLDGLTSDNSERRGADAWRLGMDAEHDELLAKTSARWTTTMMLDGGNAAVAHAAGRPTDDARRGARPLAGWSAAACRYAGPRQGVVLAWRSTGTSSTQMGGAAGWGSVAGSYRGEGRRGTTWARGGSARAGPLGRLLGWVGAAWEGGGRLPLLSIFLISFAIGYLGFGL
jgi:hypothetical protein